MCNEGPIYNVHSSLEGVLLFIYLFIVFLMYLYLFYVYFTYSK